MTSVAGAVEVDILNVAAPPGRMLLGETEIETSTVAGVGVGVADTVGLGVAVGFGVGVGVMLGFGVGVGLADGVGEAVGLGVGVGELLGAPYSAWTPAMSSAVSK